MNYPWLDAFGTLKVVIRWEHDIGEPKRKHKKKRIAKKWLKRYGTWSEHDLKCCPYHGVVLFDDTIVMSRPMFHKLKNYTPKFHPEPHHGSSTI